jgi:hypothetical protein
MLIADKIYQPKAFPMIPTKNMYDLVQAVLNSDKCSNSEFIEMTYIIGCYHTSSTITYKDWNELSYCFDTYVGNTPILNFPA